MKCANCQMLNNIPETPCTHCGRMLPALKPIILKVKPDADEAGEGGEAGGQVSSEGADTGEDSGNAGEGAENGTADDGSDAGVVASDQGGEGDNSDLNTPGEVEAESGHVDNVGDPSESETVT